ncbi:TetR/AcrR family transcriptional regulator [Ralstonia sp. 24A2]|uniref:TetR/AcrR family transcriptional regulator n=1 Tax=Ralstonia sp. 24A2 TaxID=3447364 RepID=UPI003F69AC92
MVSKGERTRNQVIALTADLMNEQGWLGVPISQVMAVSGLQKGGLYRHFESREALAYAAFDYAVARIRDRLLGSLEGCETAPEQLLALIHAYQPEDEPVPLPGGCPIMNVAIESDHAHAGLRERAVEAMSQWRHLVEQIVLAGMRRGELRNDLDPAEVSAVLIGGLEGGVMLSHLYGSPEPLLAAVRHLHRYVEYDLRQYTKEGGTS